MLLFLFIKVSHVQGRDAALSIPVQREKDRVEENGDGLSIFSSIPEKENEELIILRRQVGDLQIKLSEKEELLRKQNNDVQAELDQVNRVAAEKDSLINSIQLQLSDAKIKLADKQAALEKTQWEAMKSEQKLEKLQNDINSMRGEFSSFMPLLNGLTKNTHTIRVEDYDVAPYHLEHLPYIDDIDDKEMPKIEEARQLTSPLSMLPKRSKMKNPLLQQLMQGYIFNPFFTNPKNFLHSHRTHLCNSRGWIERDVIETITPIKI
ncbi:protein MICROTUBULE BINDING PROTEIN 2C-like [Hibiscus syriacus]|uniref:protein MICROTUBULE BINDING PROTEIN 2C-like n=1 Tax=Hibiscus syriacus TaxID=106335 RepID=UPI00192335A7|nr:protein MICROTUBULE BINDING PROTEIN 2C-like [Hibiscus syriacus]